MENKCTKCKELPPKNLQKGHGTDSHGHCQNCARIVAPRASNKSMKEKRK